MDRRISYAASAPLRCRRACGEPWIRHASSPHGRHWRAGRHRSAVRARRGQKGVVGPCHPGRRPRGMGAAMRPQRGIAFARCSCATRPGVGATSGGRPVCSRMKLGPAGVDVGAAAHANPGGDTPRGGRTPETPERGSLPPDAHGGRAHRLRMQPFGNMSGRLGDETRWNTISTSTVWRDAVAEHQKVAGWVAGKRRRRAPPFRLQARVPTDPGTETESGWAPPFGGGKVSH